MLCLIISLFMNDGYSFKEKKFNYWQYAFPIPMPTYVATSLKPICMNASLVCTNVGQNRVCLAKYSGCQTILQKAINTNYQIISYFLS